MYDEAADSANLSHMLKSAIEELKHIYKNIYDEPALDTDVWDIAISLTGLFEILLQRPRWYQNCERLDGYADTALS